MYKLKAIFILIRLPNLVFIFLTQIIAYYFLLKPNINLSILSNGIIYLFAFSTLLIAAAGYMINDYFDIGIDAINKPERVTIEKIFKRRAIIIWHIILNVIAVLIVAYIVYRSIQLRVVGFQVLSIFLLIVYSTTFKRKLILGNLIISILTSLTLLSLAAYEPSFPLFNFNFYPAKIYWLYMCFAFLVTFCREVVKDIEDIKGDGFQNCKTIPLVWGIQMAKKIVYSLISILLLLLLALSIFQFDKNLFLMYYWILLLIIPLLFVTYQLHNATNAIHFHKISTMLKLITFAGILSMIFI